MSHLLESKVSGCELFRGSFLNAYRDTVALATGVTSTREYVVHPGAVMAVPLLLDASGTLQLVLERQFRYPVGQVIIEFPAGKLDPGETSLDCAKRELQEETGYRADFWAFACTTHPVVAYSTEHIDIWFARGLVLGERRLDDGEALDVFTATPEQFFSWCRAGTVTDAKTLVAALWLQNLLSGVWTLDWNST